MGSDVDGEILGPDFKGYTLRITGGNDKQGFTMKQGILVNGICGPDLSVLALKVLVKGEKDIVGLTH